MKEEKKKILEKLYYTLGQVCYKIEAYTQALDSLQTDKTNTVNQISELEQELET